MNKEKREENRRYYFLYILLGGAALVTAVSSLSEGITGVDLTTNWVTKSVNTTAITNSTIWDNGSQVNVSVPMYVQGSRACTPANGLCNGSSSGTPGGANSEIQFNNNGSFGGDNSLRWDSANGILYVSNSTTTGQIESENALNVRANGAFVFSSADTVGDPGDVSFLGGDSTGGGSGSTFTFDAGDGDTRGGDVHFKSGQSIGIPGRYIFESPETGYWAIFNFSLIGTGEEDRTFVFPDESGTVALVSDIPSTFVTRTHATTASLLSGLVATSSVSGSAWGNISARNYVFEVPQGEVWQFDKLGIRLGVGGATFNMGIYNCTNGPLCTTGDLIINSSELHSAANLVIFQNTTANWTLYPGYYRFALAQNSSQATTIYTGFSNAGTGGGVRFASFTTSGSRLPATLPALTATNSVYPVAVMFQ